MKIEFVWGDRVISKDGTPAVVYSCGMNSSQTEVVIGVHNRIFIYSCTSGQLQNSVRGHREQINCVRYSSDGERFATASDDTNVVMWNKAGTGIQKYTHGTTVSCLAFCPVSNRLASGADGDIAIWSPVHSAVTKTKIHNRCLSMDWSADGMFLITGHADGTVWLRDQKAQELASIKCNKAVHALAFLSDSDQSISASYPLCVTSWDGTMHLYCIEKNALKALQPPVPLGFDVCALLPIQDGMLVGGSDQRVSLYSNAGKFLRVLTRHSHWVWDICGTRELFAAIINSAELMCFKGVSQMVHASYADVYAQRSGWTDIVIHALRGDDESIRQATREYVSKLALYRHRLVVQLPDRILVYCATTSDGNFVQDFAPFKAGGGVHDAPCTQYKLRHKISKLVNAHEHNKENIYSAEYAHLQPGGRVLGSGPKKGISILYPDHHSHPSIENQALACSSQHLILMSDRKLVVSTFTGEITHIWRLDAMPRFLKVVGGASGNECVILALKDGSVLQYQLSENSLYPSLLHKIDTIPRCVDINCSRDKLAVVDTQGVLSVVDLISQNVIYTDKNVSSAIFNNVHKDMLCYSTSSFLVVKTGLFAPTRFPFSGVVTAFVLGKVFALTSKGELTSHDVHLSSAVQEYQAKGMSADALRVANLGASEQEWLLLGLRALLNQDYITSQQAFAKVRDTRALGLVHRLSLQAKQNINAVVLSGDVCAHFQWFDQAAALYLLGGAPKKAQEMFLTLKLWKQARKVSELLGDKQYVRDLLLQQAQWQEEQGDSAGAADILWESGQYEASMTLWLKADSISEAKTRFSELITLVETNSVRLERDVQCACCRMMSEAGEVRQAVRGYLVAKDKDSAVSLLVSEGEWIEAMSQLDEHIQRYGKDVVAQRLAELVLIPYAEFLASQGQYEEAHKTYLRAGRHGEATALMTRLVHSAIDTGRLPDAAYLYYLVQANCIQRMQQSVFPSEALRSLAQLAAAVTQRQAEWTEHQSVLYRCAHTIDLWYTQDPFCKDPLLGFYAAQRYLAILQQRTAVAAHAPFLFGAVKGSFVPSFSSTLAPELPSFTSAYETPKGTISSLAVSAAASPAQYETPRGTSALTALLVFARTCTSLRAYKTARTAYTKALQLQFGAQVRSQIDTEIFELKSYPFSDTNSAISFNCVRCQKPIPQLNSTGDCCGLCGTPVIRCAISHKPLPIVEFTVQGSVNTTDALRALHSDALVIKTPPLLHAKANELLTRPIFNPELNERGAPLPIRYGVEELTLLPAHWVFCRNPAGGEFKPRWFLRLIEEVSVHMCYSCGSFTLQEEAEEYVQQHGHCAVCRTPSKLGAM